VRPRNCLAWATHRPASDSLPVHPVFAIDSLRYVSDAPHDPPDRCLRRLSLECGSDTRSVASGVGRFSEIPSKGRVAKGIGAFCESLP
jgi:hypothetical protein